VEKVKAADYDLILMDMQMPVMDGVTATREIRKAKRQSAPPIVAMTANVMQDDRERCEEAGMCDHVGKPIEPDELWRALLRWIAPRHTMEAIGDKKPPPAGGDPVLPSAIPGLDVVNGLRRMLGKKSLYLYMLRKFCAGQKTTVAEIRRALGNDDWETAQRHAHTLKGVSGNIGATEIQRLAERVEGVIKGRKPRAEIDELIDELHGPLMGLIAQLTEVLVEEQSMAVVPVDPARLKAVCGDLEGFLADNDPEAGDTLDTYADLLHAAFPDHYCKIDAAIRSFDFDEALLVLNAARSALALKNAPDGTSS
jgi:two-component system sensor histidine kinase/response regulator